MLSYAWENKDMGRSQLVEIENKSDVVLHGLAPGKKMQIKVDRNGLPLDRHWRRRLKDSEIDGCIEVAVDKPKKAKKDKKAEKLED